MDACKTCEPGANAAPAPVAIPTVGELWEQWVPFGSKRPSWEVCLTQANAFKRVRFKLDDGREVTMFELPWDQCTAHAANLYRAARTMESNGRTDKNGNPGHVSDSTVNRELGTMQSMLSYHRDTTKKIPYNPIDSFHRTDETPNARQTALSPEQVQAFLADSHPVFADICMVAFRSVGMRSTEVRLLKKSEVDWEAGVINLPAARNKNRKPRPIPFPVDVDAILKRHAEISRGPYVIVDPKDPKRMKPVSRDFMQYHLEKARKASGMKGFDDEPIVVHTLRHSGVTAAVASGAPDGFTRVAAGMSPKTFARYVQFNRQQQEVLRGFLNRAVLPPTPITSELKDERAKPKRSPALTFVPVSKTSEE